MRCRSTVRTLAVIAGLVAAPAISSQPSIGAIELLDEWSATGVEDSPLDHPMAVAISPRGELLVADSSNSRIVTYGTDGSPRARWELPAGSRPVGLGALADGTVLVADYTGDRVLHLAGDGRLLRAWGQTGSAPGQFQAPTGIAVTPTGNVVVVEFMGQRVQELDAQGQFVRFIEGGPAALAHVRIRDAGAVAGSTGMPMPSEPAAGNPYGLFRFPSDVAAAPDGTLYVSNTHAYEILVFNASGDLRDAWGGKGAAARQWEVPVGVAVDAQGNVFVADSANFRVQGVDPQGRVFLLSRADERWFRTTRRIYSPTDVAIDRQGRLVVVDFAASRIERFRIVR